MKENFVSFNLVHIPRSDNVRADFLEKEARARGYILFHISQIFSVGVDRKKNPPIGNNLI